MTDQTDLAALPLTPEEEAKARKLLARKPRTDDDYAWRRWASDLTWIVPLYVPRLIATLDAERAAGVRVTGDAGLREAAQGGLTCLVGQHRSVVSEFSGNFGGHVAIRDGWVEWDEDTTVEECPVCEAIAALRAALAGEEKP